MNTQKFLIYLIVFFIFLTFGIAAYQWEKFTHEPLIPNGTSIAYDLKFKTSASELGKQLHKLGILSRKKQYLFTLLAYWRGDIHHLQAGEYLLEGGVLPERILKKLVQGEVIWRRITFVEGWNFQQIKTALQANSYLHHTLSPLTPEEIMISLGHPSLPAEGQFFPDTYFFKRGTADTVILKKAFFLMQKRLNDAWNQRAGGLNYSTPYQALIAASIIEKESGLKSERPLIADVLLNRNRKGMPLQMDSTVSYGLGGIVQLTRSNLKETTPFNTYLNKGWPPTPIAMPGLDAIHAALHPGGTSFLYFVATGKGGHHFSGSVQAHNKAVMQYRAYTRKIKTSVMPYLLPDLFITYSPLRETT